MRTEAQKAKWAAYMRDWRARKGTPERKRADLDRSRPDKALKTLNPKAYTAQYMRWRRSEAYVRTRNPSPLVSAADSG